MKGRYIIFCAIVLITSIFFLSLSACVREESLETDVKTDAQNAMEERTESPLTIVDPEVEPVSDEPIGEEKTETPENDEEEPETLENEEKETSVEEEKETNILYLRSETNGLNVRNGAGTAFDSVGTLDKGDLVAYLGEERDFYRTYYKGKTAYVSKKYAQIVEMQKASNTVENVIAEGVKLLGISYVYGAVRLHDGYGRFYKNFDGNKFDCSSLMQYVFYKGANVLLQVNTRTQVYQGRAVTRRELRRGDLLFFTNASRKDKTGIERIGHVGLYLGDGYMLHTASDHAVIEKISALRWSYFITGRRIVE